MAPNITHRDAGRVTRVVFSAFPFSRHAAINLAIEVGFAPVRFPLRARLAIGGLLHFSGSSRRSVGGGWWVAPAFRVEGRAVGAP